MIFERLYKLFTSVRLTVALLGLGAVLVFWGTLAQVHLGTLQAQNEFFRSFFIFWHPSGSTLNIPVFPGGYLVGGFLLINLFSAHLRYYRTSRKKAGIVMIHLGIVLLLLGQLLTDLLAHESGMHLRNGEVKNYSEADRACELAVIETTAPDLDTVVAVPDRRLRPGAAISVPQIPFTIRVKDYYSNSSVSTNSDGAGAHRVETAGGGPAIWWRELPRETNMERRDMPSGLIELVSPQGTGSMGSLLVSTFINRPQEITTQGRRFQLILRQRRFYKPFSFRLLEFRHDRYAGTEIPKNFSSRVRLQVPETGEDREVLIKMNTPLRFKGETFYQASFDQDDGGTVLQVVHNPGWLTPYFSCILVGAGLVVQFLTHLIGFAAKRRTV
jgi:hypothetical protein